MKIPQKDLFQKTKPSISLNSHKRTVRIYFIILLFKIYPSSSRTYNNFFFILFGQTHNTIFLPHNFLYIYVSDILFLCPKYAKKKKIFFGKQRILNFTRYNCGHHSGLEFFLCRLIKMESLCFLLLLLLLLYSIMKIFLFLLCGRRETGVKGRKKDLCKC